jgi:hypothetical protein
MKEMVIFVAAWMAIPAAGLAAAGRIQEPPVGVFHVTTEEDVDRAAKLGCNVVQCYDYRVCRRMADPADPLGKALARNQLQYLYTLGRLYNQVALARDIGPKEKTIPVVGVSVGSLWDGWPASGRFILDGEPIAYTSRSSKNFLGCVRGPGARSHKGGTWITESAGLAKLIAEIRNSPLIWGYWLADDPREGEKDSLREASRVIRSLDPKRPILIGEGGDGRGVANLSPGIYLYPFLHGKLDPAVRARLPVLVRQARGVDPNIQILGMVQAYSCPSSKHRATFPTPDQLRDDARAYRDAGCVGLFAYAWGRTPPTPRYPSGNLGIQDSPQTAATLREIFQQVRKEPR